MRLTPGKCLHLVLVITGMLQLRPIQAQWLRTTETLPWETDYNTARKRAADHGLPLFVVIGTQNCYYCRKLENGPLRDPQLSTHLQRHFVLLKIDAHREPELTRALRVQAYPTIVIAGPDGKIHAFLEGYMEASRLEEHCKRTLLAVSTTEGTARDFEQARQALASGDYPRAVTLLRQVAREAGEQPIGQKARQLLEEIEQQAATELQRVETLLAQGQTPEALAVLTNIVRSYAGTLAAERAAGQINRLTAQPDVQQLLQQRGAQDLLAAAREDFRLLRLYDCLLKCEQLQTHYANQPEAQQAAQLLAEIRKNPHHLARACDQLQQRTIQLSLLLAEAWLAQGKTAEAAACFERVMRLAPDSPEARVAATALSRLKAQGSGIPTSGPLQPDTSRGR